MKLNAESLKEQKPWLEAGYELPSFDREMVMQATKRDPFWIHFGAGNIFRAFQASTVQTLLNEGVLDRGLIAAEGFDYEIIEKINHPHDDLTILATLKADGQIGKKVVGSVMESLRLAPEHKEDFRRLKEIFTAESLQMATFTITEKGYRFTDSRGELQPSVARDFESGPEVPESYMGKVTALLYTRYREGNQAPIAMVSMDNCSHNGEKLYEAVHIFAKEWCRREKTESGFLEYIENPQKVSFPWTMIDKITPRPDVGIERLLQADGVEAIETLITEKHTYSAPFVNAEECEYLVIEDAFPNGRPELEKGGFLFVDRKTVERTEKMKVCTCLNPLHTALAVFGCLLGYEKISDEMKDAQLRTLAERIGYEEGLPVVVNPGVLDPKNFLDTVLQVRLPNPFLPDTPQRIATDTSQKLAIRFGETVKAYQASDAMDADMLQMIPLVYAGWLRYLMGIDDQGNAFPISPDPLYDALAPYIQKLSLGKTEEVEDAVGSILHEKQIFGVDLYEAGLAEKVCGYLSELLDGTGAVRKTLMRHVNRESKPGKGRNCL